MQLLLGGDASYSHMSGGLVKLPLRFSQGHQSNEYNFASPKQAMKPIRRPLFGIILDSHHTLFADAIVIRFKGTDGLLKH